MVAHSSLSDNLNMNFDASVEMDNQVHFWDLENRNLDHLVRQNVDSCPEYRRICKQKWEKINYHLFILLAWDE